MATVAARTAVISARAPAAPARPRAASTVVVSRRRRGRAHQIRNTTPSRRRRVVVVASASASDDDAPSSSSSPSFDPPWSEPGYKNAVVSAMPAPAQAASVAAAWSGLGFATWLVCAVVGPFTEQHFPGYIAWSRATWPILGLTYVAAGAAHFALPEGFDAMVPHRGAWGFWYLPGSNRFHVEWTVRSILNWSPYDRVRVVNAVP
jgi:hypothetical protein